MFSLLILDYEHVSAYNISMSLELPSQPEQMNFPDALILLTNDEINEAIDTAGSPQAFLNLIQREETVHRQDFDDINRLLKTAYFISLSPEDHLYEEGDAFYRGALLGHRFMKILSHGEVQPGWFIEKKMRRRIVDSSPAMVTYTDEDNGHSYRSLPLETEIQRQERLMDVARSMDSELFEYSNSPSVIPQQVQKTVTRVAQAIANGKGEWYESYVRKGFRCVFEEVMFSDLRHRTGDILAETSRYSGLGHLFGGDTETFNNSENLQSQLMAIQKHLYILLGALDRDTTQQSSEQIAALLSRQLNSYVNERNLFEKEDLITVRGGTPGHLYDDETSSRADVYHDETLQINGDYVDIIVAPLPTEQAMEESLRHPAKKWPFQIRDINPFTPMIRLKNVTILDINSDTSLDDTYLTPNFTLAVPITYTTSKFERSTLSN